MLVRNTTTLERPVVIIGRVMRGHGRGKKLGFPTANIEPDATTSDWPKHGVYAGMIEIESEKFRGKKFLAAVSVGHAKTFDATQPTIEPYILDFNDDIYGERVRLTLTHYLRDMEKFKTVEAMVKQIRKDVGKTKEVSGRNLKRKS